MKTTYEELAVQLANAESKCRELAAENAALKEQEPIAWHIRITDEVITDPVEANMWRGTPLVLASIKTPATAAFLAEVRAQGLERLAKAWYAIANETVSGISISESSRLKYRQRADDVADFANEIRQEAAQ